MTVAPHQFQVTCLAGDATGICCGSWSPLRRGPAQASQRAADVCCHHVHSGLLLSPSACHFTEPQQPQRLALCHFLRTVSMFSAPDKKARCAHCAMPGCFFGSQACHASCGAVFRWRFRLLTPCCVCLRQHTAESVWRRDWSMNPDARMRGWHSPASARPAHAAAKRSCLSVSPPPRSLSAACQHMKNRLPELVVAFGSATFVADTA